VQAYRDVLCTLLQEHDITPLCVLWCHQVAGAFNIYYNTQFSKFPCCVTYGIQCLLLHGSYLVFSFPVKLSLTKPRKCVFSVHDLDIQSVNVLPMHYHILPFTFCFFYCQWSNALFPARISRFLCISKPSWWLLRS
jgi:hypothetical protein